MGDQHLSELCRGADIDPIFARLRQIAPETADADFVWGVWGYRDDDGRTALHWAIALKNFDLANAMMAAPYNAPPMSEDTDRVTPFITACMVGAPVTFIEELLDRCVASFDAFMACPALQHTEEKDPPVSSPATAMGTAGVSRPAEESDAHATPASLAAGSDAASTVSQRILNAADSMGNTALLYAVSRGNIAVVKLLLERGANMNLQNSRGQTVLHRAVSRGGMDMVELLVKNSEALYTSEKVQHRRWMNLQDTHGDTALFYASMENNKEVGQYLLRHGASREQRNKDGKLFWEV